MSGNCTWNKYYTAFYAKKKTLKYMYQENGPSTVLRKMVKWPVLEDGRIIPTDAMWPVFAHEINIHNHCEVKKLSKCTSKLQAFQDAIR